MQSVKFGVFIDTLKSKFIYIILLAIIFSLGIPVYLAAKPKMRKYEKAIALVIGLAGILALIMILRGGINF